MGLEQQHAAGALHVRVLCEACCERRFSLWNGARGATLPCKAWWWSCRHRAEVAAREQQRLFSEDPLPADGFDVDSISLWCTIGHDKSLQSWRLVKEFPLKQQ